MTTIDLNQFNEPAVVKNRAKEVYYNNGELTAPDGYEYTGEFRPPEGGELFHNSIYLDEVCTASYGWVDNNPRLILKKKEPIFKTIKVYSFRLTGEHRQIKPGEYGLSVDGEAPEFYHFGNGSYSNFEVAKLTITEERVEVK